MKSKLNPNAQPWYPERKVRIYGMKKILKDIIPTKEDLMSFQGDVGETPTSGLKNGNFDPKWKLNQTDNRY